MKYLTICDGGNVRSHALAFYLKSQHGREAIAVGRLCVSPETMMMMCSWADRIVLMQPHMITSVPDEHLQKCRTVDVGPDRYGIWIHPDLISQVVPAAAWLVENERPQV